MSKEVAHKSWWQIFEVVFGIPFLVAIGLQRALPLSWSRGNLVPAFILAGALFLVVGIMVIVLARREFSRYVQPTNPGLPTREMITTGVFSNLQESPLQGGCELQNLQKANDKCTIGTWHEILWQTLCRTCQALNVIELHLQVDVILQS
jgi:hypothetical protein